MTSILPAVASGDRRARIPDGVATLRHRPLRYRRFGRGQPLVLVHGWCCHGGFWTSLVEPLARHCTLVVPDLRGHGASPAREPCDVPGFAQDVCDLVEALELRDPLLVGHSLGAAAVLEAVGRLGCPAAGLVLVDPFVFDYGHLEEREVRRLLVPFRRDLPKALRLMVGNLMGPSVAPQVAEEVALEMARTPPAVALPALESLLRWDPERPLQRLGMPCIAVATDSGDSRALRRHAGRMRITWMRGTGHFPMIECPGPLTRHIRRALAAFPAAVSGRDAGRDGSRNLRR